MANTYTVYEVIGKKEDVSDVISNISPTDTPFQSMIGKESISNVLFQWQEDTLANAAANAQYDGFDASEVAASPTTLRENYSQILAKAIKVAATTDATSRYGRAKETAYQLSKRGAELKRDLEFVLTNAQAGGSGVLSNVTVTSIGNVASVTADAARTMKSAQAQVDASLLNTTGGSGTAMTETLLNTTLQELYTAGANPKYLMIPPGEALNLSTYLANTTWGTRQIEHENGNSPMKIVNVVDVYQSPFGEVKVILNRFMVNTDHLVFNPSDWKLCVLRAWERVPLAKIGDSERHMIVGEYSLKHANYKASAVVRKSA
jgi:hypothetical protein